MAPRPKNPKRPRTISKDDWDRMGMKQKIRALENEGIKASGKKMSSIAGRSMYAEKSERRKPEFRGVMQKGEGFAKKLNDPMVRAELGGRSIMKYNKGKESAGRMKDGKRVYKEGAEARLSALQKTIKEALDFFSKETAKNAARKAKRLK
jgi:hypothetical protein